MSFEELKKFAISDILSVSGKEKLSRVIDGHISNLIEIALVKGAASRQGEIDELQKRIDKALERCYTGIRKQGGDYYLELVEEILKGQSNG